MAARSTMAWLITHLRAKVNDTGSDVWTDDELEDYLDLHRIHVRREHLQKEVDEMSFYSAFSMMEGAPATWSGTTTIALWDSDAGAATEVTPDSWSLIDGVFVFSTDQDEDYYLDAKSYNIHGAIAECMEQLAMDQDRYKQWSRGGVSYTSYGLMELAKHHRNFSGPTSGPLMKTYRR